MIKDEEEDDENEDQEWENEDEDGRKKRQSRMTQHQKIDKGKEEELSAKGNRSNKVQD